MPVGCQPEYLIADLNYEIKFAVMKLLTEPKNILPETTKQKNDVLMFPIDWLPDPPPQESSTTVLSN